MGITLFTTFSGRIGRLHWWVGNLILLAAQLAAGVVLGIVLGVGLIVAGYHFNNPATFDNAVDGISIIAWLVFLLPTWALYAKRLHDRGKSVKWMLLFLVPVIGWLWLLVELGFLRGSEGPNQYGPDPLAG